MEIKTIREFPGKLPKPLLTIFGFLLVLGIGNLDLMTGYDVSLSVLYLFPIGLIAWFEGGVPAVLIAVLSAVTWAVADLTSGHMYSHIGVSLWNDAMVLGLFLITAYSVRKIRKLLVEEHEHAADDYLTHVTGATSFYEHAHAEIVRAVRYGRHLAYVSIGVDMPPNDARGHGTGQDFLRSVGETIKTVLRSVDIIARLNDREFAILLPETNEEHAARAVGRVRERLLDTAGKNGWQATFSMGVVTCLGPACTLDKLKKMARDARIAAEQSGANMMNYLKLE